VQDELEEEEGVDEEELEEELDEELDEEDEDEDDWQALHPQSSECPFLTRCLRRRLLSEDELEETHSQHSQDLVWLELEELVKLEEDDDEEGELDEDEEETQALQLQLGVDDDEEEGVEEDEEEAPQPHCVSCRSL